MINPMSFNSKGTCWNCSGKRFSLISDECNVIMIEDGKIDYEAESTIEETMICENCGAIFGVYKIGNEYYPASPLKDKLGLPQYEGQYIPEYKCSNPFYKED